MTAVTMDAVDYADRRRRIWAIFGSSSGNLVEWYDFYAYAFTALYFAPSFFPNGNQTTQLLQTAAVFAIGFFMRPIGGYVFGFIADKYGRKNSMMISVLMMCAGSLAIAIMPTYATIGTAAPILLLLARMVQGFSVGGEYGTSATYMSEVALPGKRGFYASFQYVTLIGGQLLASLVVLIVQQSLSDGELRSMGLAHSVFLGSHFRSSCAVPESVTYRNFVGRKPRTQGSWLLARDFQASRESFLDSPRLHRRRIVDLLHFHDLHAEVSGQYGTHERPHCERGNDRRAPYLYDYAAGIRNIFRPLRPQDVDASIRWPSDVGYGAADVCDS